VRDERKSRAGFASLLAMSWSLASFNNVAADEGGVSFWLPGQYASFAAMPYSAPGWAFELVYYHAKASASVGDSYQRHGGFQIGINTPSDLVMATASYVLETPVLGAQAAVGLTALVGRNATSVSAMLAGPGGGVISGSRSDDIVGFGDLSPNASLSWSQGVHNVMVYTTANIPVGAYNTQRLSALGIGHWSVDAGAGYTYYNENAYSEKVGFEWSAVLGFTYNFINPYTQYQSGIDMHLDWAISPYVSETMHVGAVGYVYSQISGDSGSGALLGDFKSRVMGIGPQIGFFFPVAGREGYLNIRGYHEFDARYRPDGWTAWVALSLSPPDRPPPSAIRKR
jgi:hypothetical protein